METIKSSLEEKLVQGKEEKRLTNDNQINTNRTKLDDDESRSNQPKGQNQTNTRISRISFSTATNTGPLNENTSTTRPATTATTNLKSNHSNYVNEEISYLNTNQKQIRPNTSTASSLSNRNNLTPGKKIFNFSRRVIYFLSSEILLCIYLIYNRI